MASSLILVGLGMAALGVGGRIALRTAPKAISNMENIIKAMPSQIDSKAWANSKYYKGGFEDKMTKREVLYKFYISMYLIYDISHKCAKYCVT